MAKNKGLGKGLNALFGDTNEEYEQAIQEENKGNVIEIPIEKIFPNKNQPRKQFDKEALIELKNSILIHGVITPIILNDIGGEYQIVAGERRYRASKMAGLNSIPSIIMDINEKKIREIALIENLQREDLNIVEVARGIKELMDRYGLKQDDISERLSMSRSNVANTLRILKLPNEVIMMLEENKITLGHAKCLAGIKDKNIILDLANLTVKNGWSVRELEKQINSKVTEKPVIKPKKKKISTELRALVDDMTLKFGTKVSAAGNKNKGRIVIDYFTSDDLERIYEIINKIK